MRLTRSITVLDRRRALVRRHHLAGDAEGPEAVVQALVALHATDPSSVYLSVLSRCAAATVTDVADAMYERRSLGRWMAMRRTLFVCAREDIPLVHAAVTTAVAATLRRRLISQLDHNGTDPPIKCDPAGWLWAVEARVDQALTRRGAASGAQLAADVPALRTRMSAASRAGRGRAAIMPGSRSQTGGRGVCPRSTPNRPNAISRNAGSLGSGRQRLRTFDGGPAGT